METQGRGFRRRDAKRPPAGNRPVDGGCPIAQLPDRLHETVGQDRSDRDHGEQGDHAGHQHRGKGGLPHHGRRAIFRIEDHQRTGRRHRIVRQRRVPAGSGKCAARCHVGTCRSALAGRLLVAEPPQQFQVFRSRRSVPAWSLLCWSKSTNSAPERPLICRSTGSLSGNLASASVVTTAASFPLVPGAPAGRRKGHAAGEHNGQRHDRQRRQEQLELNGPGAWSNALRFALHYPPILQVRHRGILTRLNIGWPG